MGPYKVHKTGTYLGGLTTAQRYGQHLTFEEVKERFHAPESAKAVSDWIEKEAHDAQMEEFVKIEKLGNFVVANMPLILAEKLLKTKFHVFESMSTKKRVVRALEHSLPSEIAKHVHFLPDVSSFPSVSAPKFRVPLSAKKGKTAGSVTPALLNKYYSIDSNERGGTVQGVYETIDQLYNDDYVQLFLKSQGISVNTSKSVGFAGDTLNNATECGGGASACGDSL